MLNMAALLTEEKSKKRKNATEIVYNRNRIAFLILFADDLLKGSLIIVFCCDRSNELIKYSNKRMSEASSERMMVFCGDEMETGERKCGEGAKKLQARGMKGVVLKGIFA